LDNINNILDGRVWILDARVSGVILLWLGYT